MVDSQETEGFFLDDVFDEAEETPRPKRSKLKILLVAAIIVLGIGGLAVAGLWYAAHQKFESLHTFGDPFAEITMRPTRAPSEGGDPVNFLILGSDSRISAGDPDAWEEGAQRTDAIMLLQIAGNRRSVAAMSIPRDSWVEIPGVGEAKINAAFSHGGPALTIETVEQLTGVRIDHVAVVDFTSFTKLTDLVGGVDLETKDGTEHYSGEEALGFVRERHGLPSGDFDRVRRQQLWLQAVLVKLFTPKILSSPSELSQIYNVLQDYIAVDESLNVNKLLGLGGSLRNMGSGGFTFLTAPYTGTGTSEDGQSIVLLDEKRLDGLSKAFREDKAKQWVVTHPELETLDSRPVE